MEDASIELIDALVLLREGRKVSGDEKAIPENVGGGK